jgi:hypothetical protein
MTKLGWRAIEGGHLRPYKDGGCATIDRWRAMQEMGEVSR